MTRYVDEYNPNNRALNNKVQTDTGKLKFNNIQSCIAVVLVPVGSQTMVGVHFTTATTGNLGELHGACQQLSAAAGGGACDAYLVATYNWHRETPLAKELKKTAKARTIYLCNVAPDSSKGANVDVKFEMNAGGVGAFVRLHAVQLPGPGGVGFLKKDGFNAATAAPGKPRNVTDRDSKPWMAVAFERLP